MTSSSKPGNADPVTPKGTRSAGERTFVERPARAKPPKQDKTTMILLLLAAFVAVGGVGFAAGHVTGQSSTGNAAASGGRGGFGGFGARGLVGPGQTFYVWGLAGRGGAGGFLAGA